MKKDMHDWKALLAEEIGRSPIGRDASSSLRQEEWEAIDTETVEQVRRVLTARNLLNAGGAIDTSLKGAGWTQVKRYKRGTRRPAKTDMSGEPASPDHTTLTESTLPIPIHHAEWGMFWRNLEASRNGREPLDVTEPREAGLEVATQEDTFFYLGDSDLSIDGILNATNRQTVTAGAWSTDANAAYDNVLEAVDEKLKVQNIVGRPKLVIHPTNMKQLRRRFGSGDSNTPLKQILDAGLLRIEDIFVTTVRAAGKPVLVVPERPYMKAWLPVDVTSEGLPSQGKNPQGTTWSASTLDIRNANAIVEIATVS